jgi:hypothetical protein
MDSSVLGTGAIVLAKADSAVRQLQGRLPLPPGCAEGGCIFVPPNGCLIRGVTIDPTQGFLLFQWAPPSGSPADLPLVYTYQSAATPSTEYQTTEMGTLWFGPYHRWLLNVTGVNPPPATVYSPAQVANYTGLGGSAYSTIKPGQNTLVGSSTTGWTETQPDGTAYRYATNGVLSSIANTAGVRWTLTWDSGFNKVLVIQGPFSLSCAEGIRF